MRVLHVTWLCLILRAFATRPSAAVQDSGFRAGTDLAGGQDSYAPPPKFYCLVHCEPKDLDTKKVCLYKTPHPGAPPNCGGGRSSPCSDATLTDWCSQWCEPATESSCRGNKAEIAERAEEDAKKEAKEDAKKKKAQAAIDKANKYQTGKLAIKTLLVSQSEPVLSAPVVTHKTHEAAQVTSGQSPFDLPEVYVDPTIEAVFSPPNEVARLRKVIGDLPIVCIVGGRESKDTEELVKAVSTACAKKLLGKAAFVTGGLAGVQKSFSQSFGGGAGLWNLLPVGSDSGYDAGVDIHAGQNADEKKAVFGQLGDVYFTFEGGPGVAEEARAAAARGALLLPFARTGSASAGMFEFPKVDKPSFATPEQWALFADDNKASIADAAEAAADVVAAFLNSRSANVESMALSSGPEKDAQPVYALKHEDCSKGIFAISDIEGVWPYWAKFVQESGAFEKVAAGVIQIGKAEYNLVDGACFVFLGDSLDSGSRGAAGGFKDGDLLPIKITEQLVTLYETYSLKTDHPRVLLVLGNRDINKLRFKTELAEGALPQNFPIYWMMGWKETTAGQLGEAMTWGDCHVDKYVGFKGTDKTTAGLPGTCLAPWEANKPNLASILGKSMGAGGTEMSYAHELGTTDPKALQAAVLNLLEEGQPFYKFLQYGTLFGIAIPKPKSGGAVEYSVFVHAGLDPDMFDGVGNFMLPKDCKMPDFKQFTVLERPPFDGVGGSCVKSGTPETTPVKWVQAWASWKTGQFQAWADKTQYTGKILDAQNRPAAVLMDYGLGVFSGTFRNAGFWKATAAGQWEYGVNTLYAGQHLKSQTYKDLHAGSGHARTPQSLATFLHNRGITRVLNGHFTDFGGGKKIPEKFKLGGDSDVTIVNLDVSNPASVLAASAEVFGQLLAYVKLHEDGKLEVVSKVAQTFFPTLPNMFANSDNGPQNLDLSDGDVGSVHTCGDDETKTKVWAVKVGKTGQKWFRRDVYKVGDDMFGTARYMYDDVYKSLCAWAESAWP